MNTTSRYGLVWTLMCMLCAGCITESSAPPSAAATLATELRSRLAADAVTQRAMITITVRPGGEVVLRGCAEPTVAARAVGIARGAPGVTDVRNEITARF